MNEKPLVSVCLPNYNNAAFIGNTIQSILNQTYSNIEILVSDNNSTDNSVDVVNKFNDPRIRLIRNNSPTVAVEENFNIAIRNSRGEFVSIYHSDDIYEKNIIWREVDFLAKNPSCAAVFSLADKIDEKGRLVGDIWFPKKFKKGGVFCLYEILTSLLLYGYAPLICPSVMLRNRVLKSTGLFDPVNFGRAADTELWLRILKNHPVGIIDEKLIHYRISKTRVSAKYNYLRTEESDFLKVADLYIKNGQFTGKDSVNARKLIMFRRGMDNIDRAVSYFIKGDFKKAVQLLKQSAGFDFFVISVLTFRGLKKYMIGILIRVFINLRIFVAGQRFIKKIYFN